MSKRHATLVPEGARAFSKSRIARTGERILFSLPKNGKCKRCFSNNVEKRCANKDLRIGGKRFRTENRNLRRRLLPLDRGGVWRR